MIILYRGISKTNDDKHNGKITPNGEVKEVVMRYGDPGLRYDGKFIYGPSKNNTARSHQVESGMHNGCCISFTRDKSIAEYFATTGNMEDGYVYVIDEGALEKYGVVKFEFTSSENLHESEVTLMASDCGEIPEQVVVYKYEVKHT